jgi:hypothetical protein
MVVAKGRLAEKPGFVAERWVVVERRLTVKPSLLRSDG